jgi:MFS family permease
MRANDTPGGPAARTGFAATRPGIPTVVPTATADTIETNVPKRLDRLPWAHWHWLVVFALGFVWILDGLEVTIVGSIGPTLQKPETLGLSSFEVGLIGAFYVAGAVTGALIFGYLTDRWGRRKLFMITLGLYLAATVATAFSWGAASFYVFRFLAGMGIGGEYSAINSAIDELIPARVRGWVDLAINGSWWLGTAAGALLSLVFLSPAIFPVDLGWRLTFGLGAVLGVGVLLTRRLVPESPRWLMIKGRTDEAEEIVADVEQQVAQQTGEQLEDVDETIEIEPRESTGFMTIGHVMFAEYKSRTFLGLMMMSAQAFAYNAVFFTYGLVLTTFMHANAEHVPIYIVPFAIGNFIGPLVLGPLFDRLGRRTMLTATHLAAGTVLTVTAVLFQQQVLSAITLTVLWCVVFFFASAAASSAYLTVSEVFPLEIRALAIAFFYAIGTAVGGIIGPALFGVLIGSKSFTWAMVGFLIAAAWLIGAGISAFFFAVDAEQKSLEEVAEPLSKEGGDSEPSAKRDDSDRPSYDGNWAPRYAYSTSIDRRLEGQVAAIERAAKDAGEPIAQRELLARANARHWGPSVARRALRRAVAEHRVERRGNLYALPH